MKEGSWGYTKFEMGNTTPEQLKADLTKNGWHRVASGPARMIDASNEELGDDDWSSVEEENYKRQIHPLVQKTKSMFICQEVDLKS